MKPRDPLRRRRRAAVYRGQELAGTIDRTPLGSSFRYDPGFLSRHSDAASGIAYNLRAGPSPTKPSERTCTRSSPASCPKGFGSPPWCAAPRRPPTTCSRCSWPPARTPLATSRSWPSKKRRRKAAPTANVADPEGLAFPRLFQESIRYGTRGHSEVVVPGVQQKISASIIAFPVQGRAKARRFILKLSPPELPKLVENEFFFMVLAGKCGLTVPPTRLIRDREGNVALLVERFDRVVGRRNETSARVHQEDVCQILDLYPSDKYNLDYADVAQAFELCSAPIVERAKLVRLIAFAYLVGDGRSSWQERIGPHDALGSHRDDRSLRPAQHDSVRRQDDGARARGTRRAPQAKKLRPVRRTLRLFAKKRSKAVLDELCVTVPGCLARLPGLASRRPRRSFSRRRSKKRVGELKT